ncbi:hypothetical protein L1049_016039 [Liquidambar formosana]|uniref:Uncharacterized protein n=1 Tax=Liquidambar formosana TaxID=63359 RepID=A0AAP0X076_LIQFO
MDMSFSWFYSSSLSVREVFWLKNAISGSQMTWTEARISPFIVNRETMTLASTCSLIKATSNLLFGPTLQGLHSTIAASNGNVGSTISTFTSSLRIEIFAAAAVGGL